MKSPFLSLFLLLFSLAHFSYALKVDPRLAEIEKPVTDIIPLEFREIELIKKIKQNPSDENFRALARLRNAIAEDFIEMAADLEDPEALNLALYVVQGKKKAAVKEVRQVIQNTKGPVKASAEEILAELLK